MTLFSNVCSLTVSAVYFWCTPSWLLWRSTDQAKVNISIASICFFFFQHFTFFLVKRNLHQSSCKGTGSDVLWRNYVRWPGIARLPTIAYVVVVIIIAVVIVIVIILIIVTVIISVIAIGFVVVLLFSGLGNDILKLENFQTSCKSLKHHWWAPLVEFWTLSIQTPKDVSVR